VRGSQVQWRTRNSWRRANINRHGTQCITERNQETLVSALHYQHVGATCRASNKPGGQWYKLDWLLRYEQERYAYGVYLYVGCFIYRYLVFRGSYARAISYRLMSSHRVRLG
jgi:hypothetical protein